MYDVAVIGAGVVGAMIARTLAAYRLSICILDKKHDVATGATAANSAIVHAGFDAKEGTLKAKLNVRGAEMMPKVCEELGVKYQNNGSLVLGFSDEDLETLKSLYARGVANGVKKLQILDSEALHRLEPNVSKNATCALWAPTGSITCPYELTFAAVGNAMDNGADLLLDFGVSEIRDNGDYFTVSSSAGSVDARYVINAAGIYSDEIAKMVGDDSFSIRARRGEYVLLDRASGVVVSHTIFRTPSKMGKGILVSPTVDGNLITGPTALDLTGNKDNTATTAEGLARVIQGAIENVENIPYNKTITSFCGLRAVGSTGDFIINMPRDRFVNVAGIESPGLSSAPAIAEYVVELLTDAGVKLEKKDDYNPIREPMHAFREASIEEKNAIIAKDPSYGHIVCRCETVSEGEILRAIRTNPKPRDLDGVKRRTRAQMGRCQGGFCQPYIVELLAKEMGVPYESITKFGGDSVINVGKTKEAK